MTTKLPFVLLCMLVCSLPGHIIAQEFLTDADFARAQTIDERDLVAQSPKFGGSLGSTPLFTPSAAVEDTSVIKSPLAILRSFIAAASPLAIWTNGLIPYKLNGPFSQNDRASIAKAINYLQSINPCLKFVPVKNQTFHMTFSAVELGNFCFTTYNYQSGPFTATAELNMTPNSPCTLPRTIVQQILQGMNWYHTHTRPDRNLFVKIVDNNVDPIHQSLFDICSGSNCNTWGQPYDCGSVMHYAKDQLSFNGQDTIVPKIGACQPTSFEQWNMVQPYLSPNDVSYLRRQYSCKTPS